MQFDTVIGMQDELVQPQGLFEERVVVAAYDSPWEAELACAKLDAQGFRAVLADANLVRLDWFVARAVGGIKVLVPESEAAAAQAVLSEEVDMPEIGLATAEDCANGPRCPQCASDNLVATRWSRSGFVGGFLLLGFPLPLPSRRWRCSRCRRIWRRDELS